jgi:hypothetical protein
MRRRGASAVPRTIGARSDFQQIDKVRFDRHRYNQCGLIFVVNR